MRTYSLIFLLFSASLMVHAQGILKGRIIDQESGQGLAGVRISVRNFPDTDTSFQSGADGSYYFVGPQANYRLQLVRESYETSISLIRIEKGKTKELLISLKKKAEADGIGQQHGRLRLPGRLSEQVETIDLLTEEEMFLNNPRTMPEALMGQSGIWVPKPYHGGGAAVIRGLTGNQNLLLVDGIRINHGGLGYGPHASLNTVDPWLISEVQVQRGGGSVAYGSDALGGVINMISRTPAYADGGSLKASMRGRLKYGGAFFDGQRYDQERTTRAELLLGGKRIASLFGLTVKSFGTLLAGDSLGPQVPSDYLEINIDFKSRFKLGKASQLTLAYQRISQDSVGRYDEVSRLGNYELFQYDPRQRSLGYMRWERENKQALSKRLSVTASYQLFSEERDKRFPGGSSTIFEREEIASWGFSLVNESPKDKSWTHISGLDIYYDQLKGELGQLSDSTGEESIRPGIYPDASTLLQAGIFSMHSLVFDSLRLNVGIRYNFVQTYVFDRNFGDVSLSPQALLGKIGLIYQLGQAQQLVARLHTGFRAPNVRDLSQLGPFLGGIEIPNRQLGPERSASAEVGYRVSAENVTLSFTTFYTRLFQLINRSKYSLEGDTLLQGQRIFARSNSDRAFVAGVEGQFSWHLQATSPWFVQGFFSYLYGQRLAQTSSPLPLIPPLHGRLRLTYRSSELRAALEWMGAAAQNRISEGDLRDPLVPVGGSPAWDIWNLYFSYKLAWADVSFKGENLFNRAYRYHGSGVNGYGRSFWLGLAIEL